MIMTKDVGMKIQRTVARQNIPRPRPPYAQHSLPSTEIHQCVMLTREGHYQFSLGYCRRECRHYQPFVGTQPVNTSVARARHSVWHSRWGNAENSSNTGGKTTVF